MSSGGLFFLGMLDEARQSANIDDQQFLHLFKAIFRDFDYDFDHSYQSKLIAFHQSLSREHRAFRAIVKGREFFTRFSNGSRIAPTVSAMLIQEFIEDPEFPASVEDL